MEEHDFLRMLWNIELIKDVPDEISNQVLEFWFSCNPDRSMWWVAARCNLRHRRWRPSNKGGAALAKLIWSISEFLVLSLDFDVSKH